VASPLKAASVLVVSSFLVCDNDEPKLEPLLILPEE